MNLCRCRVALTGASVLLVALGVFAQPPDTVWTRTYGGLAADEGHSVCETFDQGFAVCGRVGYQKVYLAKVDKYGDTVWTREFGGGLYDCGFSVVQTRDSGYVVAGRTGLAGGRGFDVYLVRTGPGGDSVWTKVYGRWTGDDVAQSIRETDDRGFIVTGYTMTLGSGDADVYLMKTDANGDSLWEKAYRGARDEYGFCVEPTSDRGYIVAGCTESFGAGGKDCYLVKTDVAGDTVWTRTYGGPADEEARSVEETPDCGYVVAGWTKSFGAGGADVWLLKTDVNGDSVWSRAYGGGFDDRGYSVQRTSDGGYVVAGETESFGLGVRYRPDVFVVRTDAAGDTLWTATFGDTWYDYGRSIRQTEDGGYIVAGFLDPSRGCQDYDVYLVRLESDVAVEGPGGAASFGRPARPTVVRGVLTTAFSSQHTVYRAGLLDATGRKVLDLVPGPNDVRQLAPGVYFVRSEPSAVNRGPSAVRRVVVAK